ncbi:cytochrome C oxidase subunit IV family protein [Verrucomicrobiales bacterium]|nr:cytochrome C oxidase subunit IV family protein [Verrucomicrobiales bacterium]MDC0259251.1 cytochrome C oxidase subunit IV family protein [Verrucomicrobiales bacterium]MDC0322216.1 cytochrome C oxidase subunit IV family protein [Verrucomicrobiales bacterium]
MASSPEEIAKHKKAYKAVGIALLVFTCVTVSLGAFPIFDLGLPGATWEDFVIGLLVATVKASLVALVFMHLNHEKTLVYKVLIFTFCFALSLMALTLFAGWDPIKEAFETVRTNGFPSLKS